MNAFTEVSASAILTGARTQVAAITLLSLWQATGGLQKASALGMVMFVVTIVLVFAAQKWGAGSIVPDMGGGGSGEKQWRFRWFPMPFQRPSDNGPTRNPNNRKSRSRRDHAKHTQAQGGDNA